MWIRIRIHHFQKVLDPDPVPKNGNAELKKKLFNNSKTVIRIHPDGVSEFFLGWGERRGLDKFVTHFLGFQYLNKMQELQVFTERMLLFLYGLIIYINNIKNEFWTKISKLDAASVLVTKANKAC